MAGLGAFFFFFFGSDGSHAEAIARTFKMDDVEEVIQQKVSLMPADLQKVLTEEELINIVEYLTTLKQAKPIKKASL